MAGLPYAVVRASSGNACRGDGDSGGTFGVNAYSLDGSLECLLSVLARLMADRSAEPSTRVSGAFFTGFHAERMRLCRSVICCWFFFLYSKTLTLFIVLC